MIGRDCGKMIANDLSEWFRFAAGERALMMEFNEKLQELRKQKNLTQEELAEALYVSRTAVSKWESGRGYPSIDSLKAIAKFFSVTIDDLLSGDEVLTLAEEDHRQKKRRGQDLVFGLIDCSAAMLLFLPFFGQTLGEGVSSVSLMSLSGTESYVKTAYAAAVFAIIAAGILTLALQNVRASGWERNSRKISVLFNVIGVLLFIVSPQPYVAALLFVFLAIKVFLIVKKP